MRHWRKCILAMCIFSMVAASICGCGNSKKSQCKEVIENFETSCNALDVTGILNCINPKISDPIKTVLALGKMVSSEDVEEYLVEIVGSIAGGLSESMETEGASTSELLASIQITPEKYKLKSKKGTVYCTAAFQVNGMKFTKYIGVDMIKKSDEWYISGITLAEEK